MFIEALINPDLHLDAMGGPSFSTNVVAVSGGAESRNINWSQSRGKWELGDRMCYKHELREIIRFFQSVRGRAHGFRFKDWGDYDVSPEEGVLAPLDGIGGRRFQLIKRYSKSFLSNDKVIKKPVSDTIKVFGDGVQLPAETDETTGTVTLIERAKRAITAIAPGETTTITLAAPIPGLAAGGVMYLSAMGSGAESLNDRPLEILAVGGADLTEITLDVATDGAAIGNWNGAETCAKVYPVADELAWSGEFHVPVRFDTDEIKSRFEAKEDGEELHYLFALPVIEIKVD